MAEIVDRYRLAVVMVIAAALLAGCAQGSSDSDRVGTFLIAPGKYRFYPCANLAAQTIALKTRERELEALIARAGPGAGGNLVSAVSYRPEYAQVRGNLIEVRKTEVEKNCPPSVAAAPPASAVISRPKRR